LKQLYQAPGIATDVDFQLHAAIRSCSGGLECPDEDTGCPGTKYVLCALEAAGDNKSKQIDFLTTWDDTVTDDDFETAASTCASSVGLDFKTISTCVEGSQGTDLETAAAQAYTKMFPSRQCGGIFGVPDIEINGDAQNSRTYDSLLSNLCSTGITAAACEKTTQIV
jgi:hypothetical protein